MNFNVILVAIIVVISLPIIVTSDVNNVETVSVNYNVFVDSIYGFYKVRDVTTYKSAPFDINTHTITINQTDVITWINDGDIKLTIVSKQGLWNSENGGLRSYNHRYNYTFNIPGEYTFNILEYPIIHMTIIVNGNVPIPTYTPIPTNTPYNTYTPIPTNIPYNTYTPIPTNTPYILEIISKITLTKILSLLVAILSLFMAFRYRFKNSK